LSFSILVLKANEKRAEQMRRANKKSYAKKKADFERLQNENEHLKAEADLFDHWEDDDRIVALEREVRDNADRIASLEKEVRDNDYHIVDGTTDHQADRIATLETAPCSLGERSRKSRSLGERSSILGGRSQRQS
jgi:hypothetical protein